MRAEKAKAVGAVGALVSSLTSWLEMLEMLPTLSSAIHLTVVVPSVVMSTLAVAALTTVAVPLEVGLVPSVVYVMLATPDPVSDPSIDAANGVVFAQPPGHGLPSHVSALVGAELSAWAVKFAPEPVLPAVSWAVTEPDCVAAEPSNV